MKNFFSFFMAFFLCLPTCHGQENKQTELLYRTTAEYRNSSFEIDIEQTPDIYLAGGISPDGKRVGGVWNWNFRIKITCTAGCGRHPPHFVKNTDFAPISLFRLFDGSDKFISLWGSGSAYRVFIFQVNKHGIKDFGEIGTRTAPQILIDHAGNPVIVTTDFDSHDVRTLMVTGIPYSFDGHRYVRGLAGAARDFSRKGNQ